MVGIICGSDSDLPKIADGLRILEEHGVPFEVVVSSAHRTPDRTREWASSAASRGIKVIIAAAGGAAHLPGVVAAHTILPVIGIPIESPIAGGLDSLLSIVQMPAGIPVAAMAAGKSGGVNAALYAMAILALSDSSCAEALNRYRKKMAEEVDRRNDSLQRQGFRGYISSKGSGA